MATTSVHCAFWEALQPHSRYGPSALTRRQSGFFLFFSPCSRTRLCASSLESTTLRAPLRPDSQTQHIYRSHRLLYVAVPIGLVVSLSHTCAFHCRLAPRHSHYTQYFPPSRRHCHCSRVGRSTAIASRCVIIVAAAILLTRRRAAEAHEVPSISRFASASCLMSTFPREYESDLKTAMVCPSHSFLSLLAPTCIRVYVRPQPAFCP